MALGSVSKYVAGNSDIVSGNDVTFSGFNNVSISSACAFIDCNVKGGNGGSECDYRFILKKGNRLYEDFYGIANTPSGIAMYHMYIRLSSGGSIELLFRASKSATYEIVLRLLGECSYEQ